MKIGGHVSIAGGIQNAPERAAAIGGNCAQIFISAPQGWRTFDITDDQVAAFKQNVGKFGVDPIFIHALYLLNLATDDRELEGKSEDALVYALTECARIGCAGVIFHIGSRKEQEQSVAIDAIVQRIKRILEQTPASSHLLIENSAGESDGRKMGGSFEEIGQIIKAVNSDRLKVCLDTEHAFAAGYDVRTSGAVDEMVRAFDDAIGIEHLAAIHANDSKIPFQGKKDRHENIGKGEIGEPGFRTLLHHPTLRKLPWLLEVPGIEGNGPDRENIEVLKRLAE